jgi:hypothetical protein
VLPIRRQLKLEFGFPTAGYTNPLQVGQDPKEEKSMVTGDLNAALVEWVVQYRIEDPRQYLFDVRNRREPSATLCRPAIGSTKSNSTVTALWRLALGWRNETCPDLFQPFGGFPDGVKVVDSYVTLSAASSSSPNSAQTVASLRATLHLFRFGFDLEAAPRRCSHRILLLIASRSCRAPRLTQNTNLTKRNLPTSRNPSNNHKSGWF